MSDAKDAFSKFAAPLVGLEVSHVWRGHGSALFLEFGRLQPQTRHDGSPGNSSGEMSLMIEWSWRIEGRRSVLCGSWSDEKKWPRAFARLMRGTVTSAVLFGRIPEIELTLSSGVRVLSFMTADGDPQWTLFDRRGESVDWIHVRNGALQIDTGKTRS
jgi:hypothetical protein